MNSFLIFGDFRTLEALEERTKKSIKRKYDICTFALMFTRSGLRFLPHLKFFSFFSYSKTLRKKYVVWLVVL